LGKNIVFGIIMEKKYRIHLSEQERKALQKIITKRSEKSQIVKRAYILLAADENGEKHWIDSVISTTYGVRTQTVERVRKCFIEEGFSAAVQGKKREIFKEKVFDGEVEAHLIALRCSACPAGYNKWTLHLLAEKMVELKYVESISHESVRQLLKKHDEALAGKAMGNS
jgi:hypothetical protein